MDEDGSGLEPWEQQPGEHPVNYHVFWIFCQLGPERSVRAAALKWYAESKQTPPKEPGSRFADPARRWRWQERADVYWRREFRRQRARLEAKRDAEYDDVAELCKALREKYRKALPNVRIDRSAKDFIYGLSKLTELLRFVYGDTEEDRKRRGRPLDDLGSLPPIEDRLKPEGEPE